MPVEIKELVIRATVKDSSTSTGSPGSEKLSTEEIVSLCVEEVLEILRRDQER